MIKANGKLIIKQINQKRGERNLVWPVDLLNINKNWPKQLRDY